MNSQPREHSEGEHCLLAICSHAALQDSTGVLGIGRPHANVTPASMPRAPMPPMTDLTRAEVRAGERTSALLPLEGHELHPFRLALPSIDLTPLGSVEGREKRIALDLAVDLGQEDT